MKDNKMCPRCGCLIRTADPVKVLEYGLLSDLENEQGQKAWRCSNRLCKKIYYTLDF